jgi:hypothetical protein
MIPGGSHFVVPWMASDGITCLTHFAEGHTDKPYMKSRTQAGPLKYYFIDFGLSVQFRSFEERELVIGEFGRLRNDIPEISGTVPYDPFKVSSKQYLLVACAHLFCKVDVRLVGEMLLHEFLFVSLSCLFQLSNLIMIGLR